MLSFFIFKNLKYMKKYIINIGDWGLGIGDWGLGIGDWAQSPNPHTPTPNPHPHLLIKKIFKFIIKKKIL